MKQIYFNNSLGDISAVDIEDGRLLWQLPTTSNIIVESNFSLETSDIIADENNLFFSNNKNQFFSIDISLYQQKKIDFYYLKKINYFHRQ